MDDWGDTWRNVAIGVGIAAAAGGVAALVYAAVKKSGNNTAGEKCTSCPKQKIINVTLISLTFISDHDLLTNYTTDWKSGGTKYVNLDPKAKEAKEWTFSHNYPISHTKAKKLKVIAEFEVTPPNAVSESGQVTGTSENYLSFQGSELFEPTNATKTNTVKITMEAKEVLPDKIMKLIKSIIWKVTLASGQVFTSNSGPHTIYVTYETPSAKHDLDGSPEPEGITLKRMGKAVELIEPIGSIEPHSIVAELMKKIPYYTLKPSSAVPARLEHPSYFNRLYSNPPGKWQGGAWPIADYLNQYAECQAIVRFVTNLIKQVGLTGIAETVYVFAKPNAPKVAEEDTDDSKTLHAYPGYSLVDKPVTKADINKTFPPSHTKLPDGSISIGFNAYEACLKFSAEKKTRYYGGGAGEFKDKQAVLKAFYALVKFESAWYPSDSDPDKVAGYRIIKILATRADW